MKNSTIKVAHLSTSLSEQSAATRLCNALETMGIQAIPVVSSKNKRVIVKGKEAEKSLIYDLWFILKRFIKKRIIKFRFIRYPNRLSGTPFHFDDYSVPYNDLKFLNDVDVIHLHWICDYLSINQVKKICKLGKPVVWTFHDSWPFTGGCHVRYGCERFISGCGSCPELGNLNVKDSSFYLMKKKIKKWDKLDITIVAPSLWMKNNAERSLLFKKNKVEFIPNTLDLDVFNYEQTLANKSCEGSKIYLLFGAVDPTVRYKGAIYIEKLLALLEERDRYLKDRICVLCVGNTSKNAKFLDGIEKKVLGFVNSESEMSKLYKSADAMIFPSIDDNLPNMVMESLACGTPVIAFETGGIPEMVEHKKNGYIAKYQDVEDLFNGLLWFVNYQDKEALRYNARESVVRKYSPEMIAKQHIELYRKLLDNSKEKVKNE